MVTHHTRPLWFAAAAEGPGLGICQWKSTDREEQRVRKSGLSNVQNWGRGRHSLWQSRKRKNQYSIAAEMVSMEESPFPGCQDWEPVGCVYRELSDLVVWGRDRGVWGAHEQPSGSRS